MSKLIVRLSAIFIALCCACIVLVMALHIEADTLAIRGSGQLLMLDARIGTWIQINESDALGVFNWSPDGTRLAYGDYSVARGRQFIITDETFQSTLMPFGDADLYYDALLWSPDGTYILVETTPASGDYAVTYYIIHVETGTLTRLDSAYIHTRPIWINDNTLVSAQERPNTTGDALCKHHLALRSFTYCFDLPGTLQVSPAGLSLSPNRQQILFTASDDTQERLALFDLRQSTFQLMGYGMAVWVQWRHDSAGFFHILAHEPSTIYYLDLHTGMSSVPYDLPMFTFSSDQRYIAYFLVNNVNAYQLYIMDSATQETQFITQTSTAVEWSPNDARVAYVQDGDVFIYDPTTDYTRHIGHFPSHLDIYNMKWRPR